MVVRFGWTHYHTFVSYFLRFFWPTALKLGCITNFDMLSLVMGFISLVIEIQFMLISSRHISNRSIGDHNLGNATPCEN